MLVDANMCVEPNALRGHIALLYTETLTLVARVFVDFTLLVFACARMCCVCVCLRLCVMMLLMCRHQSQMELS